MPAAAASPHAQNQHAYPTSAPGTHPTPEDRRPIAALVSTEAQQQSINVAFEIESMIDGDGSGKIEVAVTTPTHPCRAVTMDEARALFEVERRKFTAAEHLIDSFDPAFEAEVNAKVAEVLARPKPAAPAGDGIRNGAFVQNVALAGMKHVDQAERYGVAEAQRRALVMAHATAKGTSHLAEVHAMAVWAIRETLRMATDPDGHAGILTSVITGEGK